MSSLIEHKLIEQSPSITDNFSGVRRYYEEIDFDALLYRYYTRDNDDKNCFMNKTGINFQSSVGCMDLTGNELFYYPELAEKLRFELDYPVIHRHYDVDKSRCGLAFFTYFSEYVHTCFADFQTHLTAATARVNNLIMLYGKNRYKPLIESVTSFRNSRAIESMIINGVEWKHYRSSDPRSLFSIGLYQLTGLSRHDFNVLDVEDVIVNTPFIAIRAAKTYKHRGHVTWYNLDTMAKVKKADILKWQGW